MLHSDLHVLLLKTDEAHTGYGCHTAPQHKDMGSCTSADRSAALTQAGGSVSCEMQHLVRT